MADEERTYTPEELEETRREKFVSDLLEQGRKSGAYLDGSTRKLPTIQTPEQSVPFEDATMRYQPLGEQYEEPETYEENYDDLFEPLTEPEYLDDSEQEDLEEDEPEPLTWDNDSDDDPEGNVLLSTIRVFIYVFGVILASVLLALGVWLAANDIFGLTDADQVVTVTVRQTDSVKDVAATLKDAGLIKYKTLFRVYCALTNAERKIDPGVYELNTYFDYFALVNGMIRTSGARKTVTVTIPEGYTVAQTLQLLAENGTADYEALCDAAANYPFEYGFLSGTELGAANRLEGYLFPDTYEFYAGDKPENVLGKFLKNFNNKMTDEMYDRLEVLNAALAAKGMEPLTLHELLAVASMIEKEAATAGERTSIASVIYNRLCSPRFPCLQIDATVQYALGEHKEILTYQDLEIDSPYNTYVVEGLPAGPIANPGLNAIKAALYPADTDFYYYALDRDGTHHFSSTLAEHEAFLRSLEG